MSKNKVLEMKPNKPKKDPEKVLNEILPGVRAKLEILIANDHRFDTLIGIRNMYKSMFAEGDISVADADQLATTCEGIHKEALAMLDELSVEDFTTEKWVNPADRFVDFTAPATWEDAFNQYVIFQAVSDFGSAMETVRQHVVEAM